MNINRLLFLIGTALITAVNEEPTESTDTAAPAGDGEAPRRRGRPPGSTNAPKESAPTPQPPTGATGDNPQERLAKNLKLIEPICKGDAANGIPGQGQQVKEIVAKYVKPGEKLKDLPAESQADFEKDLVALRAAINSPEEY